ncbi:MAG: AI-2E family transporter [Gemmatimonadaceae bacterium]
MTGPTAAAAHQPKGRVAPVLTAVVLTVLLLWLLGVAADVFLLLFIAVIFSLYLGAVTDFLVTRVHMPRGAAFAVALISTVLAIVGLFWLLVPPVADQTRQLIQVLPTYIDTWEGGIDRFMARFPVAQEFWKPGEHRATQAVYGQVSGWLGDLAPKVFSLVHVFISIFSVLVMAIYLTLHPGIYREWLIALFPPIHRDLIRDVLRDLADTLRAYITGQLFAMFVLGVMTAFGLWLLGVPYWLTFGVFTSAVAIIPFFGTLISTALPALFVLGGPGGMTKALWVVLLGVGIHLFESNIVQPVVMARKVELPPVLTIMSVLVVAKLLGPVGLVVAVPILATVMVVVRRILINRIYEGKGFRRATRDVALLLRVPAPEGGVLVPAGPPVDVIALREKSSILTVPPVLLERHAYPVPRADAD